MMISETFNGDVYIADFTDYNNTPNLAPVEYKGVTVGVADNEILPSFVLRNPNSVEVVVVNNEKNSALFTREDGTKVSNCECIVHTNRKDNRKGWILFLELKYCKGKKKNVYDRMLDGIYQLKATCKYVMKEMKLYDDTRYKLYLVISIPGVEPLDPFDASYFLQEDILAIKEETGALLKAVNEAEVLTPALIRFG